MSKWEYCAVHSVLADAKYQYLTCYDGWQRALDYFTVTGGNRTEIKKGPDALAQAIAELGEQGWEMVGCGNVYTFHVIYFKRPKT